MKRSIIKIDEDKCNGCGLCVPDCPEGALQIIDGKARLVSDLFCDGLGACIKTCPEGAMLVEEREAEPYDEWKVMENVVQHGENVIKAHLQHLDEHGETGFLNQALEYLEKNSLSVPEYKETAHTHEGCGCAGSAPVDLREERDKSGDSGQSVSVKSELRQWPVQLKLLNPAASYFDNAELLISSDCVPFTYGNFHQDFLKGKMLIMFCPKLDPYIDEYVEKLAAVFSSHDIKSITIARMEVPCCGGVNAIIEKALEKAGKDIPLVDKVISIQGQVM